MTVKKKSVENVKEEVEVKDKKYLDEIEKLKMEAFHLMLQINLKDLEILTLKSTILSKDIELLGSKKLLLSNKSDITRSQLESYNVKLKKKYDISSIKWGYDPISLEIKD